MNNLHRMIFLKEDRHPLIDENLEVTKFCPEVVRSSDGELSRGVTTMVAGSLEDVQNYFKKLDGVWVTTNPMIGDWEYKNIFEGV